MSILSPCYSGAPGTAAAKVCALGRCCGVNEGHKWCCLAVFFAVQRRKGGPGGDKSIIVYELPYSEHSSYPELKEFVQWLEPTSIIPHVHNDGGPKTQEMISLLRG